MFHPDWLHSVQKSNILSVSLIIFPQQSKPDFKIPLTIQESSVCSAERKSPSGYVNTWGLEENMGAIFQENLGPLVLALPIAMSETKGIQLRDLLRRKTNVGKGGQIPGCIRPQGWKACRYSVLQRKAGGRGAACCPWCRTRHNGFP